MCYEGFRKYNVCYVLVNCYVLFELTEKPPLEVGLPHTQHFKPKNVCSLRSEDVPPTQHHDREEKNTSKQPKLKKK